MSMQRLGKGLDDRESPGMSVQISGKPSKARARRERTPCAGSQARASVKDRKKEKSEKIQVQEAVKVPNAKQGKQEGRRRDKAAETAGKPSTGGDDGDSGCVAATGGEERESGLEDVEQEWFLCKVILFKTRKELNNDLRMLLRVYLRFIESCCGELFHHLSDERAAQLRTFKQMAPLLVRALALEIAVSEQIDPECPPPVAAHHPRVPPGAKEEERVSIAHGSNNTSEDVCGSPVGEAILQGESSTELLAEHLARTFVCLTREVLGDLLGPYMKHMLDMIDNYCDILTENRDEPLLQDLYRQLPDLVRAVALEVLVAESNGLADPGPAYDYNAPLDFKDDHDSHDAMIKMTEGMDGMEVPGEGLMGAAGAAAAQAADLDEALAVARGAFRAIEAVFDVERLFRDLSVACREWPDTAAELLAEWAAEQDTQQQRLGGPEEPLGPAAAEGPAQATAAAPLDKGSSPQQPMEQMNKGLSPPISRSQSLNKLQEGKTQPLETACQAAVPLNATADMDKEKKKSSKIKEGMMKGDGEEAIETTVVGSNNIANNGCPKPSVRNLEKDVDLDCFFCVVMVGCARETLRDCLKKLLHIHLHFMESCCDILFKNLWDEWAAETRMFTQKLPMLVRAVILDIVLTKCPYSTSRPPAGDHTPTGDHKSTALPDEKEEACGGDGPGLSENDCCRSTLCELQSDSSAPLPLFKTLTRLMHEMLGELVGKWLRDVVREMRGLVMGVNKETCCHESAVFTELMLQAPMLACAEALMFVLVDSADCVRTLASDSTASSDAEGRIGSQLPRGMVDLTERWAAVLEAALGRARAAFRDIEDAYDVERLFRDLSAACRYWPRAGTAAFAEAAARDQRRRRRRRCRRLRKLKRGSKAAPLVPAPTPDHAPKIDTVAVMART